MYSSLRRNFIIFLIALLLVAITRFALHSAGAASAGSVPYEHYLDILEGRTRDQGGNEYEQMLSSYHARMNGLFNDRIKKMVKAMEQAQNAEALKKLFAPPQAVKKDGLPVGREACGMENLSTYCLAQSALEEYFAFREAMLIARDRIKQKIPTQFETISGKNFSGAPAAQKVLNYGETIDRIDREIDIARQALDQGLAAYNEMQTTYPLHKKYQEVIKSLTTYRDKISAVRKQIERFPPTFLDVTTTKCT